MLPEGDFIEVYMDVPLQVCEERDPKGLYKLANSIFGNVPATVYHTHTVKAPWSDASFTGSKCYQIPSISFEELVLLSEYVITSLEVAPLPDNFSSVVLILASHLLSPANSERPVASFFLPTGDTVLPETKDYAAWRKRALLTSRKQYESLGRTFSEDPTKGRETGDREAGRALMVANPGDRKEFASKITLIKFCAFFCAYLMRLCVKDIKGAWTAMILRFSKFFRTQVPPDFVPKITNDVITDLKAMLSEDKLIAITWLRVTIPHYEMLDNCIGNEGGLLNYLVILHFTFSGMHALKLFEDVLSMSNYGDVYLLKQLMHPSHNKALIAMADIFTNHYPTEANRAKPGYVRYARVFGSQYYPELQSKKCQSLIATLAELQAHFITPGEGGARNPMDIKSIANISATMRAFAKNLAAIIVREAPKKIDYMYSTNLTIQALNAEDNEEEESEDEALNNLAEILARQ